jgi:hypothetical protein
VPGTARLFLTDRSYRRSAVSCATSAARANSHAPAAIARTVSTCRTQSTVSGLAPRSGRTSSSATTSMNSQNGCRPRIASARSVGSRRPTRSTSTCPSSATSTVAATAAAVAVAARPRSHSTLTTARRSTRICPSRTVLTLPAAYRSQAQVPTVPGHQRGDGEHGISRSAARGNRDRRLYTGRSDHTHAETGSPSVHRSSSRDGSRRAASGINLDPGVIGHRRGAHALAGGHGFSPPPAFSLLDAAEMDALVNLLRRLRAPASPMDLG